MPTFVYRARNDENQAIQGQLDAADQGEVVGRLRRMGYHLLSVEEVHGTAATGLFGSPTRVNGQSVAIFTAELALLLRAGMPLASALQTLIEQTEDSRLVRVIEQVRRDVEESGNLSEAMATHPRAFPPVYTAAIQAGEEGGLLAEILARLGKHLKRQQEIRAAIRAALAYPLFVTAVGAIAIVVLATVVIPRFTSMFLTMTNNLPWPTQLLLAFGQTMDLYWPIVLAGLVAIPLIPLALRKHEATRRSLDAASLKLPVVGSVILKGQLASFARTLAELLRAGVPIVRAVQVAQGVVTNRALSDEIAAARDELIRGQAVSEALGQQPHFTKLIVSMSAIGEESGQLPEMLTEVADIYDDQGRRAIDALTSLVGPALIVILGGIVGFVVTAILLPVFQAGALAE